MSTKTSVQKFRDALRQPVTVQAPSGIEYTIRKLSPVDYIENGLDDLPNEFFQFIFKMQSGLKEEMDAADAQKNYDLFEKFLRITVEEGMIDPPCILRYDKEKAATHIVWGEIDAGDQGYLAGCITGRIKDDKFKPAGERTKTAPSKRNKAG